MLGGWGAGLVKWNLAYLLPENNSVSKLYCHLYLCHMSLQNPKTAKAANQQ